MKENKKGDPRSVRFDELFEEFAEKHYPEFKENFSKATEYHLKIHLGYGATDKTEIMIKKTAREISAITAQIAALETQREEKELVLEFYQEKQNKKGKK